MQQGPDYIIKLKFEKERNSPLNIQIKLLAQLLQSASFNRQIKN